MKDRLRRFRNRWLLGGLPESVEARLDHLAVLAGSAQLSARTLGPDEPRDLRVFSQWGEDGILHDLARSLPGIPRTFVEIGVEDYRECNTRFLAATGWSGLALDGNADLVARAQQLPEVASGAARVQTAWVEPGTVNQLIEDAGVSGEIGVLSLDIDGVDFYVLAALTAVRPWIVVCEFNARYGADAAVAIPYREGFDRREEHYSWLHYGMSLGAVEAWGQARGYVLVGTNLQGTNAFLVDAARAPSTLQPQTTQDLWRPLPFSEHRNRSGVLQPVPFDAEVTIVSELPVVDVRPLLRDDAHDR